MSLRTLLQEITLDDVRAAAIGTMDGTVIEAVVKDTDGDLTHTAADLGALLKVGAYCARKLEGGALDSVSLSTERLSVLVAAVTVEHYIAVVLRAGGNLARARLTVKKRRSELVELLS